MQKYSFDLKQSNIAKGFFVMVMVFHHVFHVHMNYNLTFVTGREVPDLLTKIALYGKVCVGGFCFLSAYGITKKLMAEKTTAKNVVISRLVKLYLAYWPIYLFGIIGTLLFGNKSLSSIYISVETQSFSWILPVLDVLGLADFFKTPMLNAHWWYMSVALYVIILTPAIYYLCKKFKYLPAFAILTLAYIIDIYSFCYIAITGLGVLCAKEDLLVKLKTKICSNVVTRIVGYLAILLLNIAGYELYRISSELPAMPLSLAACLLLCYVILADIPGLSHVLAFLGKHSANIYYVHGFLYLYWFTYTIYSLANKPLIYVVVLAGSLALSIILELIKKLVRYNKLEQTIIQKLSGNKQ